MSTRELVVYLKTPDRDPIVGREVTCVLKNPDVFENKIVQATRPFREITDSDGRVAFDLIPSSMLDNQTKYLVWWLDLDESYEISMPDVDSVLAVLLGETGDFTRANLIAGDNITLTFVGSDSVLIATPGQAGGDDEVARTAAAAAQDTADAAVLVNTQQTADITTAQVAADAAQVAADAAQVAADNAQVAADVAQAAAQGAVDINTAQALSITALTARNEYTTPEKTKLTNIQAGAQVNVGQTYTQAEKTKLTDIEPNATDDQTGAQIVAAIDAQLNTDAWQEPSTGAVDQTARDDAEAAQVAADAAQGSADNAQAAAQGAVDVNVVQAASIVTLTARNEYTTPEKTKLTNIQAGAQVNVGQTYTQAEKTKLTDIEPNATDDQAADAAQVAADDAQNAADTAQAAAQGAVDINTAQAASIATLTARNEFTTPEKTKLGTVFTGAQANVGQEYTQPEKTKLGTVATGAQVNLDNYEHSVLTQAEYDAIANPDANTIYLVTA